MGFCAKGLKNEFESAVVNEPSVFEPLKSYCMYTYMSYICCKNPHNNRGLITLYQFTVELRLRMLSGDILRSDLWLATYW